MTEQVTTQSQLSREDMDQIAAGLSCTISLVNKPGRGVTWVYLRHQGAPIYFGYLSTVEKLSARAFAAKIVEKLRRQYV